MTLLEFIRALVVGLAAGAGGAALINALHDRWKFRATRNAELQDREEAKNDKIESINKELEQLTAAIKEIQEANSAQSAALKFVLLDRILYLGQSYINKGGVSFDDRKRLGDMHYVYHNRLGGNGDADAIMDGVYSLPLR